VRQILEEQLGQGLRELATERPQTWKKLVRGHSDVLLGWAVKDNEFFERVEDIVPLRTTRGLLSLPDYLQLSGGALYYVSRELGSLQERLLAEGRDVPAIDASWFAVTPFLEKYAARHPNVGLVQLDGDVQALLRPVAANAFAELLEHYRKQGINARIASFKPPQLPALMIYPQGAEIAREAEQALEGGELPGPLAGLVSDYVEQRFGDTDLRGVLYLNASCPLVRRLAEKGDAAANRAAVLTILYQLARLFCGRLLNAADAAEAFDATIQSLGRLMGDA